MDAAGLVRVGFAAMDQIKLTAELLAEGWSAGELDRKARSGEVQRIRRAVRTSADQHDHLNAEISTAA
jgi:hypothetical protein